MIHLLLLTVLISTLKADYALFTRMGVIAVDFEVYGRVQGVFFRIFTKEQAEKLNLRGWCKNTADGTVLGHIEGAQDKVEAMMHWLQHTGSPSSRIDKVEFRNQKEIVMYSFDKFSIRKD